MEKKLGLSCCAPPPPRKRERGKKKRAMPPTDAVDGYCCSPPPLSTPLSLPSNKRRALFAVSCSPLSFY